MDRADLILDHKSPVHVIRVAGNVFQLQLKTAIANALKTIFTGMINLYEAGIRTNKKRIFTILKP
ncbi:hypothetical protein EG028_17380 [Chitinophaga barathri]|uniref:Uncharacterized protein n=1 Tax=Chitinophaga barathri TaxID=1647451 RepID=A0A3N4MK02_9BACT|nr:hypothetical protein EG028_17380 [Chitinophaga barathri]